jgi:hypothetical protein
MDGEGIAFADRVRIACGHALAEIGLGRMEKAIQRIDLLCGEAEKIVHGAKMQAEVADENRYDLQNLKIDLRNSDSETGDD